MKIRNRKERVIDLILLNNPSPVNRVSTMPQIGLSDHVIVHVEYVFYSIVYYILS